MKINRHVKASFYTGLYLGLIAGLIFLPPAFVRCMLIAIMIMIILGLIVGLYFVFLDDE